MQTKLVVIESPYSGETERNLIYARRCLLDSIQRGEAPLASHLLYTQVLDDANHGERTSGMQLGWAWMQWADEVIVYIDYGVSTGMQHGIDTAEDLEIKITRRAIGVNP